MMHKILLIAIVLLLAGCGEQSSPSTPAQPPDEKAAIAALGQINQAQKDFIRRNRRYALGYDDLIADHLLQAQPAAQGYRIDMKPSPDGIHYTISAAPADASSQARHLFTDETGIIRGEQGKDATAGSPAL